MQVAITCKHGSISAENQEYITRKSEKLITYFERVTAIVVTISFEKGNPGTMTRIAVEILVDAEHKHNFVAKDEGDELIPTFDLTMHKMEHQIRKYKERIQDHRRTPPMSEAGSPPESA